MESLASTLELLEKQGLIRRSPGAPEEEFAFRHAMIQEAAYGSLLHADRRRHHRSAGILLEALEAERLEEIAPVLAHHFVNAAEVERGVHYSRLAAQRARALQAPEEAVRHLQAALALLQDAAPGPRSQLLEGLADCYRDLGAWAQVIPAYEEALQLARESSPEDMAVPIRLQSKIANAASACRWSAPYVLFEEARRQSQSAREWLFSQADSAELRAHPRLHARLLTTLSRYAARVTFPPDWAQAEAWAKQAVAIAEGLPDDPLLLNSTLGVLGVAHYSTGRLRDFLNVCLRRLALLRDGRIGDPPLQAEILREMASAWIYVGEFRKALDLLQEAADLARRASLLDEESFAVSMQVQAYFRLDLWDKVLEAEARARRMAEEHGKHRFGPACFEGAMASCVHAWRGERTRAQTMREEATQDMRTAAGPAEEWQRNQHY